MSWEIHSAHSNRNKLIHFYSCLNMGVGSSEKIKEIKEFASNDFFPNALLCFMNIPYLYHLWFKLYTLQDSCVKAFFGKRNLDSFFIIISLFKCTQFFVKHVFVEYTYRLVTQRSASRVTCNNFQIVFTLRTRLRVYVYVVCAWVGEPSAITNR